jgi:hypothetical protein
LSSGKYIVICVFAAMLLAASVSAYDADPKGVANGKNALFVDKNNPDCRDSISRSTALKPATPFCSVTAALSKMQSGDTIYIREGTYNGYHLIQDKNFDSQVTLTAYPGEEPQLINAYQDFLKNPNTKWTKHTDSGTYWSASLGEDPGDKTAVHMSDGTLMAAFGSSSRFKSSKYDSSYVDKPAKKVYVKFKDQSKNPNQMRMYISKPNAVLDMKNVRNKGMRISDLKIEFGSTQIFLDHVSNSIIEDCTLKGGFFSIYMQGGDNRDVSHIRIRNNDITSTFKTGEWIWMNIKGDDDFIRRLETSGIKMRDVNTGNQITGNRFSGWFDGISDQTTESGRDKNTIISGNTFSNINDDAIEIENRPDSIKVYDNIIYDAFVGISLSPADCGGTCEVYRNQITTSKEIRWTGSEWKAGECFKMGDSNGQAKDWNIYSNTCVAKNHAIYGIVDNAMSNVRFTDNIFVSDSYTIFHSGLSRSGVYYNNNLYYAGQGGILFKCWNQDNSCTDFTTISGALKSSIYGGGWDTKSKQGDPQFTDRSNRNYKPRSGSPACTMSTSGGHVGAVSCGSSGGGTTPSPSCGDGSCNGNENCTTCSRDCGSCPPRAASCGDGLCTGTETCSTCASDCGVCAPVCGDGSCNGRETCSTCQADCGACQPEEPAAFCGDGECNGDEDCESCSEDCGSCRRSSGGGGGGGGSSRKVTVCSERWICSDWSPCVNGSTIRACEDLNSCGTIAAMPATEKDCVLPVIEPEPEPELELESAFEPEYTAAHPEDVEFAGPVLVAGDDTATEVDASRFGLYSMLLVLIAATTGAFVYLRPQISHEALIADPLVEIKHLVKVARQNGYDDAYIRSFLLRHGLAENVVKDLVKESARKARGTASLSEWHSYMDKHMKMGFTLETIRRHLLDYGYEHKIVEHLIRDYKEKNLIAG